MSSADMKNRVDEERRNPAALENQQKSLENQQKSLENQQQGLKLQQESLENQQQANELQKEANLIRRQQLEAQEAANKLASESIEVQKDLSKIQRQYYNEQIKIDSRMLEIAEERAERERNIVFCRWCGRQMPFAQIIDYLDVEVCSLQCRKMYRQHLIEENRLMYCDHCGNDLILDVVERDYDNVTLEAGVYDALIIELGSGLGDNWWCIVYPPLCFVNKSENNVHNIQYQSYLMKIIKKYFG